MNCNWPELTIDELKSSEKGSIAMGPFGSRIKAENFVKSGVPVLKGGNLHGAYIDDNECDYLTEEKADELKSSNAFEGDIVITHRGTIGQVSIIPKGATYNRYVVSQSQLKVSLDKEKVNPYYVNYFLRSRIGQHRLLSYASQVGVPAIAKASTSVKQIQVPCPPLAVQDEIVSFLQSLDHKLTVNNQINQSLEEMAQAIFKSWFVDFDPVKAKMNGAQPEGMDAATASLFPEKLVESELGLIPDGWGVGELSKLFELHRGFDLPKSKRQEGGYPVYAAGGYHGNHNEFKMEPPGIITGRSGVIGSVYLSLDKYWPLNTTLYVREFRACGPYYAYHLLRSLDLKSLNSGSAVPSLNRNFVHSTSVCHPDSEILAKFEKIVKPLFEKMVANNEQNKSLSELRDTLLPKLLSGEIELAPQGSQ
ncbi:restriction endonuclease subunit S [Vibrio chagasii]|uniref:restriction endonuclease subunit S n=1 Tax=Vibrio chagasii TaxID=170679 RepID=UPI0040699046